MNTTQGASALSDFDPAAAGQMLAQAWRSGSQLPELPEAARPRTLREGYDLQDRFIALTGDVVAGWKLGVGSPNAMRAAGLARPLVGRVLQSHCHQPDAVVPLPGAAPITVEFEIAFVLGCDIGPDGPPASLADAVSETRVTFELVLSRFSDRRSVGWPSFAGDNVGFEALVVGNPIDPEQIDAIAQDVVVSVDGEEKARGLAGDDLSYPWKALAALMDHARERGITLHRGQIITTGAIARPFDVAGRGARISARFPGGHLHMRTVAATI